jgi:hypothetical protein
VWPANWRRKSSSACRGALAQSFSAISAAARSNSALARSVDRGGQRGRLATRAKVAHGASRVRFCARASFGLAVDGRGLALHKGFAAAAGAGA